MLKVSIITVCYNSEKYIKHAIESVLSQTYKNIEYIIVDGKSKDNTVSIINKYRDRISTFISEPDKGIYDAMNKGILSATGDIIGILNSDDFYIENNVIEGVVSRFQESSTDSIYANINYVRTDNTDKIVRKWICGEIKPKSFARGWQPAHPAFFVKREIYFKHGIFNIDFKLSADFELMLRFLVKCQISTKYYDKCLINMRLGGATNQSVYNIIAQNIECIKAFKVNNIPVSILYPLFRLIPKVNQYIFKKNV